MTGGQGVGDRRREGAEPRGRPLRERARGKAEVQGELTLRRTHRLLRLAKREREMREGREGDEKT